MYMMTCKLHKENEKYRVVNIDGRGVSSVNELYKIEAVALLLETFSYSDLTSLNDVIKSHNLVVAKVNTNVVLPSTKKTEVVP